MHFCGRDRLREVFAGKRVAIVGSGPGCLNNEPGFIDSHQIVVRVNNFKLTDETGLRTDVHYSFYGGSIKKTVDQLRSTGVKLCMCKCPDAKFMESKWHRLNRKMNGVDFRSIYVTRRGWWFCDTYVPTLDEFLAHFNLLNQHVPTTGFAAILDVLALNPASLYLTGFDFFESEIHNVDEKWRAGDPADPIGHSPERERRWLNENKDLHPITFDRVMAAALEKGTRAILD